jgi:hypothetical protein
MIGESYRKNLAGYDTALPMLASDGLPLTSTETTNLEKSN